MTAGDEAALRFGAPGWYSACDACRAVGPLPAWALWRWAHDARVARVGLGAVDLDLMMIGRAPDPSTQTRHPPPTPAPAAHNRHAMRTHARTHNPRLRCVSRKDPAALGPPPPAARAKPPSDLDDTSLPSRLARRAAGPRADSLLPAGNGSVAPGGAHCGELPVGFYEWVEMVMRIAYLTHGGAEARGAARKQSRNALASPFARSPACRARQASITPSQNHRITPLLMNLAEKHPQVGPAYAALNMMLEMVPEGASWQLKQVETCVLFFCDSFHLLRLELPPRTPRRTPQRSRR